MESEKAKARPNFFFLLDMDHLAPWDPEKFEQILKEKIREWSREAHNRTGQKKFAAQMKMEMINQIREVMLKEDLRARETTARSAELETQRLERIQTFEFHLDFFNAGKTTTQSEIDKFVAKYQHIVPPDEIIRRIDVKPISPDAPPTSSSPPPTAAIDPTTLKIISEHLDVLSLASLYELLDCTPSTDSAVLLSTADQLYKENAQNINKSSRGDAKSALFGHARIIFASEETRRYYDTMLRNYPRKVAIEKLVKLLEDYLELTAKRELSGEQVRRLLDQAQANGLTAADAWQELDAYARQKSIHLDTISMLPYKEKITCGACGVQNDADQSFCTHCHQALYASCPDCNARILGTQHACGHCGFQIGNRYQVDKHLEEIAKLLRLTKPNTRERAKELIIEAQSLWQPKKEDERATKLKQHLEKVEHLEQDAHLKAEQEKEKEQLRIERETEKRREREESLEREQRAHNERLEKARLETELKVEAARLARLEEERRAEAERQLQLEDERREEAARLARERQEHEERLAKEQREETARLAQAQQELLQQQRVLAAQVQDLIERKFFFAARQFLFRPEVTSLPTYAMILETVTTQIARVEEILKPAQLDLIGRDEKILLCRQALFLCSDYPEAQEILRRTPPSEPSGLQATMNATTVQLSWEASSTREVSYTIRRKAHTQPASLEDGEYLATVSGLRYIDEQPEHGHPLFYAVFTLNEALSSTQGAQLIKPVLFTDSVTAVRVAVVGQGIKLSWTPPAHTHSVLIVVKEGSMPLSPLDYHNKFECDPSSRSLYDQQVLYDHIYYYVLYARYKNHEGRLVLSPGVSIQALPETPPQALRTLHLQASELDNNTRQIVTISWQRPHRGQVIVIRSTHSLREHLWQTLSEEQVKDLGTWLHPENAQTEKLLDTLSTSCIIYYTPVVLFQNLAYIGSSYRHNFVAEVTNLRQQNLGSALRLQWIWPEQCQQAWVTFSTQDWLQPGDPDGTTQRINRTDYELGGYFDLAGIPDSLHYITVSTVYVQDDEELNSKGVRITGYQSSILIVTYEVRPPTRFKKQPTLLIKMRVPGSLPTVVLVGQRERIPTSRLDGNVLYRQQTTRIENKALEIELPAQLQQSPIFTRLFLEEDSLYEMVQIYHPHQKYLRCN